MSDRFELVVRIRYVNFKLNWHKDASLGTFGLVDIEKIYKHSQVVSTKYHAHLYRYQVFGISI